MGKNCDEIPYRRGVESGNANHQCGIEERMLEATYCIKNITKSVAGRRPCTFFRQGGP